MLYTWSSYTEDKNGANRDSAKEKCKCPVHIRRNESIAEDGLIHLARIVSHITIVKTFWSEQLLGAARG